MSAGDRADVADVRPLPVWLRDPAQSDTSAELPVAEESAASPKLGGFPKEEGGGETPGALALILAELRKQSLCIEELRAALAEKEVYQTRFDVLTMVNVVVDAVCEEAMAHVRSTVEYTDLLSTVTLSFVSGEVSLLLEEMDDDVDFWGVKFTAGCVLSCHLAAGAGGSSIVVNIDTDKITDVTQLTLVAVSEEATRELYQALTALCGRGTASSVSRSSTPLSLQRAKLTSTATPLVELASASQLSAAARGGAGSSSQSYLQAVHTPTMRRRKRVMRPQLDAQVPVPAVAQQQPQRK
ncbi:uncharacterized protein Tco025E_03476 [Trypanosoma conorhini]|uniref:Uncharacterized protein n=1 Tax=Trypanosoma conorhini TaxID=83891 RepID=A0A3R7LVH8_9TRYP|nr:uncharacterized protein Tco025E_03476 [Trypanosoma conorhini]RNF21426.1 hypothetical protein Tco025E_03476 [Trypanosoma conorhini]